MEGVSHGPSVEASSYCGQNGGVDGGEAVSIGDGGGARGIPFDRLIGRGMGKPSKDTYSEFCSLSKGTATIEGMVMPSDDDERGFLRMDLRNLFEEGLL